MNSPRQPVSALWCLNTDHRIEKKFAPVTISNGLVWTQDTQTFYYIDTPRKCVLAFDFDNATGNISNQRTLWDTSADPSSPDGMTIDSEDRLWVAFCHGAKVVCFDPATKKIEAQIDFPCVETTACAFGGPAQVPKVSPPPRSVRNQALHDNQRKQPARSKRAGHLQKLRRRWFAAAGAQAHQSGGTARGHHDARGAFRLWQNHSH